MLATLASRDECDSTAPFSDLFHCLQAQQSEERDRHSAFLNGRHAAPAGNALSRSGAVDSNGDELRRVVRLQPHQHGALALLVGVRNCIANIERARNLLAADIEDDIAGLEPMLGSKSVRIDVGDHDAIGEPPPAT
jgi:hypothetical protein